MGTRRRTRRGSRMLAVSLDHLVGAGEEGGRDGEAERLGCLHVDHQLEFGGLLYRQIGRLGALEDLIDVAARAAKQIGYIGPVGRQSATFGGVSEEVVCRQMMPRRERDD